jgi:hypothetical protein
LPVREGAFSTNRARIANAAHPHELCAAENAQPEPSC